MGETWFSDNFQDDCVEEGVNAGFQFTFYCERCGDAWQSQFEPFRGGQAGGWLEKASGMFGGVLDTAADAVGGLAEAGFGGGKDKAFAAAVTQAKTHFHRCAKCTNYVCERCFNAGAGLCYECAPSAEVEIESAHAEAKAYAAGEKAALDGIHEGKHMDVKTRKQLVCPSCGAEAKGAKFCPECGTPLAQTQACASCGAESEPGTKFCPECGAKFGG